ncbi:SGNH/GDSL hydrolase family protein [Nocardia sp. NBC_01377]|uniref:SGNH/GDSL hydrolase family protein n=1 Tax=Nocardia sp. NBC_01377 TaxID=2903595 RepID=UPI00386F0FEC
MTDSIFRTEADDPMLVPADAARELLDGAPWRRFAVIGDSVALGVGDPSPGYLTSGWSDRVAAVLRSVNPELAYLNTGRVGATIGEVIAEQLGPALDFRPDLIHVTCGGNDLFARGGPEEIRKDLDALFAALSRSGAQIFTFILADVWETERMAPMRPLRDRMAELNDIRARDGPTLRHRGRGVLGSPVTAASGSDERGPDPLHVERARGGGR